MSYFIVFTVSFAFAVLSVLRDSSKAIGIICSGVAVVSLSVLNWIRDSTIGTDVLVYGNNLFATARASRYDFSFFLADCRTQHMSEYGYALLNYVIAQFTGNVHVFYLLLGLCVNGIFYIALFRIREIFYFPLAWLTFLLLIYPATLNLLRQGIALSLVLLMGSFALSRRYVSASVCVLVAYTFHHSSIFALLILAFIVLIERTDSIRMKNIIEIAFLFISALVPTFVGILNRNGLLPDKYEQYVSAGDGGISLVNAIVVRAPFVILAVFYLLKDRASESNDNTERILLSLIAAESLLLPLQQMSSSTFRIALYLGVFKTAGYAFICHRMNILRPLAYALYVAYLLLYFYMQTVAGGSNGIYPFIRTSDSLV